MDYIMHNSPVANKDWEIICATHPAQPGTYMRWPNDDFTDAYKENVILWAVMEHGWVAPITMGGVWGGVDHGAENRFVQHPDGSCHGDGWDACTDLKEALEFLKKHRPGRAANAPND